MSEFQFLEDLYEDEVYKGITLEHQEIRGVTFSGCSFNQCSFEESTFKACRFQDCVFIKCKLSMMKVDGSTFRDTRFEDSRVIGVNWAKAAWGKTGISSRMRAIDFDQCVLNYSSFMGLALEKINLHKCIARDVDFSDANLKLANCSFTDFTNSRFRHTDLTEADFTGATNYFIQPQLNTLKKTRFSLPDALSLLYNLDIEIVEAVDREKATGSKDQEHV